MKFRYTAVFIVTACLLVDCELFVDENVDSDEMIDGVLCSVPETTSQTVHTSRAGELNYCSQSWSEATDSPECVSEEECQLTGLTCVKTPGKLTYECRMACGDGQVCLEDQRCRQCKDSSPHCGKNSSCPDPRYPTYDGYGEPCTGAGKCRTSSKECCSQTNGLERVCVERTTHFTTMENTTTYDCDKECNSYSDCPDGWCCLSYDIGEDEYASYRILDASESTRTCWPDGIYDFCP